MSKIKQSTSAIKRKLRPIDRAPLTAVEQRLAEIVMRDRKSTAQKSLEAMLLRDRKKQGAIK